MDKSSISMGDVQWYLGWWDSNHGGILTYSNHLLDPQEFNAHLWNFGRHGAVRCLARWIFITFVFWWISRKLTGKAPLNQWEHLRFPEFPMKTFPAIQRSMVNICKYIWLFWTGYVWCTFWTFKVWNVTINKKNISSKPSWIFYQWAIVDGNGYNGWNQPKNMGIIWISSIKVWWDI